MFVAFTHIYPPSAAICLALFHFGERFAYAMWAVGIGRFFVVAVIVASVQAVHGCFGCLCTWAFKGNQDQESEGQANIEKKVALANLDVTIHF